MKLKLNLNSGGNSNRRLSIYKKRVERDLFLYLKLEGGNLKRYQKIKNIKIPVKFKEREKQIDI